MKAEIIDLYKYYNLPKKKGFNAELTVYFHDDISEMPFKRLRPAMLVAPGGGYGFISEREGEPVAVKFFSAGFNTFILNYTVGIAGYPVQLTEICMAMAYIRENAAKYSVDPQKVCAVGFSAGGHLVGSIATLYKDEKVCKLLGKDKSLFRPDAVILSYGVLSLDDKITHKGTKDIVTNNDKSLYDYLDVVKSVHSDCPPAYIWATREDDLVDAKNSLDMALKYHELGLKYELHIFEKGWHGLSTGDGEVNCDPDGTLQFHSCYRWVEMAIDWLKAKGFKLVLYK